MARLTIQVPDSLRKRAETRAAESGHASLEAYVEALIRADAGADAGPAGPDHLRRPARGRPPVKINNGYAAEGVSFDESSAACIGRPPSWVVDFRCRCCSSDLAIPTATGVSIGCACGLGRGVRALGHRQSSGRLDNGSHFR